MAPKKVGLFMREDWIEPIMFYSFKCPKHGQVVNYAYGGDRLECPICLNELKKKEREKTQTTEKMDPNIDEHQYLTTG